MFNNHFFDVSDRDTLQKFMKTHRKLLIVTDPPFGGRVEVLAHTLKKLSTEWSLLNGNQLSGL